MILFINWKITQKAFRKDVLQGLYFNIGSIFSCIRFEKITKIVRKTLKKQIIGYFFFHDCLKELIFWDNLSPYPNKWYIFAI